MLHYFAELEWHAFNHGCYRPSEFEHPQRTREINKLPHWRVWTMYLSASPYPRSPNSRPALRSQYTNDIAYHLVQNPWLYPSKHSSHRASSHMKLPGAVIRSARHTCAGTKHVLCQAPVVQSANSLLLSAIDPTLPRGISARASVHMLIEDS